MSRKKISSTIYVTPEQSERLKLLSERTKVPASVYIREGIDLVLKRYEAVLPGQLSLVADAPLPMAVAAAAASSAAAAQAPMQIPGTPVVPGTKKG
jgi:hypothetical protein